MFCTSLEYYAFVTLPLFVFSAPFRFLLPMPMASLAMSLAVCVAAAIQAELPPNRSRPWSRPLVGWLFFLQPIVRGWARYQARLELQPRSWSAEAPPHGRMETGELLRQF